MATPESVIEIGSTGVRLLVAEFDADRKQNILDRSEMPLPLGKNVFTSGIVNQETQNQLIQVLKRYSHVHLGVNQHLVLRLVRKTNSLTS